MRVLFLILLIITFFAGVVKGEGDILAIKLTDSAPVQYCNVPVPLAESLTIEGNFILTGMKVSINEGYNAGEDTLVYKGSIGNIVATWYELQGYLLLKGDANTTVDNYRDAIKLVRYKNNKLIPTLGTRKITITLEDADYYVGTEHFYRFVSKSGIKWTEAEAEAKSDAMKYYGLRGYLATITSMYENSFIQSKTKGVGWIGASDATVEGDWRWVTGPEGLNGGLLFWKGTGYQAKMNNPAGVYGPVNGVYHNWNRWDQGFSSSLPTSTWEPNQSGEEDYAHITYFPSNANDSYKWNDLPNIGGSGDYASAGYLIEFGGTPGDPKVYLSATLNLQVNTMLFVNRGIQAAICEGESIVLNKADTTRAVYSWTPADGSLSSTIIASPTAKPKITTTYLVTATRGVCTDTATYKVKVNPKPLVSLGRDTTICNPGNILLTTKTQFESYHWLPNAETTASINVIKNGNYSVNVTDISGCKASAGIKVSFTDKPKMEFSGLNTLICGKKSDILNITTNKGSFTVERLSDGIIFNNLSVSVPDFGSYNLKIKATDEFSCYSDSVISFGFRKTPTVDFSVDSTKCYGYNLDVKYLGDATRNISDFVWIFGGDTLKRGIGVDAYLVPLGINRATRDLKLIVTDQGCSNDKTLYDIKVIPNLKMKVLNSLGCEPFTAKFVADNTETVTYDWNFGDGNILSGPTSNPSNTYLKDGYFPVKLKVTTSKGCSNEVRIDSMVYVAPIPTIGFTTFPAECLEKGNHEISYNGTGDQLDTYLWDLSKFDSEEIINNPGKTQGPLVFNLKNKPQANIGLKVISKYNCQSKDAAILVKRIPDFSVSASSNAGCIPFVPLFSTMTNDPVDHVNYSWDFGDGTTGSGDEVNHAYTEPDHKYDVVLTALSSTTGCFDTLISKEFVFAYPKPKAAFSMDNNIVYNDKPDVKFTDNSVGAATWLWNFGDGITSNLQNPSYHFVKMGHQVVSLEVANTDQCTDTVSQKVLIAFDRLFPPTGFSPNAPNEIDRVFKLNSEGLSPEGYHFTVLSRWNDIVFEVKDEIKGWDGRTKNGTFAPAGVYVWILNFTDFLGRKHRQTGTVTLVY